ncbi:hypothetical protein [Thermomonospora cellulosilytica]|uniref:Uncharacterized protein n=1 Tax=Thermomonospora cellulosilytica TaxID=1411118 RepID=A0A7W3MTH8_9ACTN|nr:hypothetical protein [Thermomonospora cellulosilytica]MBA9001611.1 hypothetical protein [Thermomonospora cellulosilytica]
MVGAVRPDVDLADVRAAMTGCLAMERQRRATGSPGRPARYCSPACRQKAHRRRKAALGR